MIPIKSLKIIFKVAPDPDVLSSILSTLVRVAEGETTDGKPIKPKPKRALTYLRKIAAGKRISMAVMLMGDEDKDAIRKVLKAAGSSDAKLTATFSL